MVRKILCVVLLLATGIVSAGIKEDEDAAAQRDMMQMLDRIKTLNAERARRENVLPYPDVVIGDPKPKQEREWISDWKQGEKQRFSGFLGGNEADVLLVPFQVQANGLERANRSLMTASLAQALSSSVKVVDPYLVSRALGDGERQLDAHEVIQLAGQLRVKRIIWSYAGHRFDKKPNRFDNRLHLYFQIQERGDQGVFTEAPPPPGKVIDTLEFSDSIPPITVFRRNLPLVVEALGYKLRTPATLKSDALSHSIPATLAAVTQASSSLANDAQNLQLLASLLPEGADRLKERLFERSMFIAWQLPEGHPSTRLLLARAFHGLHMRPSAIALLDKPNTTQERALVAALNGNLPELDGVLTKMSLSPQKIMAEIDAVDIRYGYEADSPVHVAERAKFLATLPMPWKTFLSRRFDDADPSKLRRFSNYEVLDLLGKEFPAAGPTIQQKLRGRLVAGQNDSADIDMAIGSYLDPSVAGRSIPVCCDATRWRPERLDILDFLVQTAVANVVYKTNRLSFVQGLYEESLNYIRAIDALFGTHPLVMKSRAGAEYHLAEKSEIPMRDKLQSTAQLDADRARYWLVGTEQAWADRPNHLASPYYSRDGKAMPGHLENARAALANATYQTDPLTAVFYLTTDPAEREKVFAETAGRFSGNVVVPLLKAEYLKSQGKASGAIALLQEAMKDSPRQMAIYKELGNLLMEEGNYPEAAKVYAKYPGLDGKTASLLMADNYAYEIGSLFFWRGETDLAKAFYKISASLGTGSAGGMTSAARNATMDGDYRLAVAEQFNAAQRYGNSYRYRDYFSLLHMLGQSASAWDGFNALVGRFATPHLWDSALVGHQRQGRDATWLIHWASQPNLSQGGRARPLVKRFLTMALITDRAPDKPASLAIDAQFGEKLPFRTLSSLFVEAYGALKRKDFSSAYQSFSEAGKRDRLTDSNNSYVLPYLAVAGAKTGKLKEVNEMLAAIPERDRAMDYWLSRAVVAAITGETDAINHFQKAINKRVFTELRPIGVEYQFADIAELLFDLTGHRQFKAQALKMAQFNQRIQPWEGWSYAVEALLAEDAGARRIALVKAVYLDRNSERLKRVPKNELEAASKSAEKSPPFRITQGGVRKNI